MKDNEKIDPKEVWEVLQQLGLHTHYLASKPIAFWDEYDRSNYRSLQIKAGKIKRVYGIYDADIRQQDAEQVTSPPKQFYQTEEQATVVMNQHIAQGVFTKDDVHILWIYKKV